MNEYNCSVLFCDKCNKFTKISNTVETINIEGKDYKRSYKRL